MKKLFSIAAVVLSFRAFVILRLENPSRPDRLLAQPTYFPHGPLRVSDRAGECPELLDDLIKARNVYARNDAGFFCHRHV